MYVAVEKPGKMEGKTLETLTNNVGGRESFTIIQAMRKNSQIICSKIIKSRSSIPTFWK